MKRVIITAALLMLPTIGLQAGEVYKWTDAEGKVHFSARPPTEKAATVEVKKYRGASPAGPQMSDEDKAEWTEAYQKQLLKVDETKTPINCSSAISNIDWQFDTMLTQVQRNLNNGSITQEQHAKATTALQKAKQKISYSRCQSATGVEQSFYECMSNDKNHFAGCGTKHNFLDM